MKFGRPLIPLVKDNLFSLVTPEQVYRRYLGKKLQYNRAFSSPFRIDKNPSFVISDKTFTYRDFATGEAGDCISFVMKLYSVNFSEALKQIAYDLGVDSYFEIPRATSIRGTKEIEVRNLGKYNPIKSRSEIKIKIREWRDYDIDFWNCHGVSLKYLRLGRVFPIEKFYLNGKHYVAHKYAYAYIEEKDGRRTYKIYQPHSNAFKWINNNDFSVWELWHLLPDKYDKLIITSSRKDALSIIENVQIPSVSLQSETMFPKPKIVEELYSRFDVIYLLLDNDYKKETNYGQEHALKLVSKHGFKNLCIPSEYACKDFSDLVCSYGRIEATNILKELIK